MTGVAGTGKSTLIGGLQSMSSFPVVVFSYSEHLGAHIGRSRAELRSKSSQVVTASAVRTVDEQLASFVGEHRANSLVLIDSHAVTDEEYGHRIIPFRPQVLASLSMDLILYLHAAPEIVLKRVTLDRADRIRAGTEQIFTGQRLQEAVAVSYSVQLGVPLYVVDVGDDLGDSTATIEQILRRAIPT